MIRLAGQVSASEINGANKAMSLFFKNLEPFSLIEEIIGK